MRFFSFQTLRLKKLRVPWSLLLATCGTVFLAEGFARWLVASELLATPTLRGVIENHARVLTQTQPGWWYLGNSVLESGFVEEIFEKEVKQDVLSLPHGGATLSGSLAMLEYYIEQTQVIPRSVTLVVSKDDLNRNGQRAKSSEIYINRSWDEDFLKNIFMLRALNATLPREIHLAFQKLKHGKIIEDRFIGKLNEAQLLDLSKSFELDLEALDKIPLLKKRYPISNFTLVLAPATQAYKNFHDSHYPEIRFDQIVGALEERCTRNGIRMVALHNLIQDNLLFEDSYHLNSHGAPVFTQALVQAFHSPHAVPRHLANTH